MFMTESKPKRYYERIKEPLTIIALIITIIAGLLTITTYFYIPNSVAFEVGKYSLLIMIPITVSTLAIQFSLKDIRKKLETKPQTRTLPNSDRKISQLDKRMDKIEVDVGKMSKKFSNFDSNFTQISSAISYIGKDVKLFKKYFVKCPNCSNPMFLPILPSMVQWSKTHEKDGAPIGFDRGFGRDPEYEVACPSCQTTWHIVYRK